MKVLVGCEFSGTVRDAFTSRGHDAISVDLLPSTKQGGRHLVVDLRTQTPEWFRQFDLAIFHPPCTYLCSSGLHWNTRRPERARQTEEALDFVRYLLNLPIDKIALENPVGCISTRIRKYDQKIQPNEYGHDASKGTCIWLINLPKLKGTKKIEPKYACPCGGPRFELALGKYGCANCNGERAAKAVYGNQTHSGQNRLGPSEERWKERSVTYQGVADAMAEQWGGKA